MLYLKRQKGKQDIPRGSAKAALHLPEESVSTVLQSVPPGNSRVVQGGFGVPAVKDILFIRGAEQ
jgi:hypothetical protein